MKLLTRNELWSYKSIVQELEESLRIRFEVHMESENKIQELKELNAKLHKANEELAAYIGKLEARNE